MRGKKMFKNSKNYKKSSIWSKLAFWILMVSTPLNGISFGGDIANEKWLIASFDAILLLLGIFVVTLLAIIWTFSEEPL
jgi:hypothetical protein